MDAMTDRAALLASVLANPDDDAPRLVMADWFDEHGEPERAEFIRLQVKLAPWRGPHPFTTAEELVRTAQTIPPERAAQMEARERELWDALWRTFAYEWDLKPGGAGRPYLKDVRRGFISAVTCSAADWLTHGDAVLAAHPVTEVRLTGGLDPFMVGQLMAETGDHPGLSGFDIRGQGFCRDPEPLLHRRWPRVRTWHLPPEPQVPFGPGRRHLAGI